MTLCAIPVMLPPGSSAFADRVLRMGFYNASGIGSFVVFNLGRTFGEAFESAKSGARGTLFAALSVWLLYTVFPDGVGPDTPPYVFWGGLAWGTLYVIVVMFLKLNLTTQIFACMNFGGYWITFLRESVVSDGVVSPFNKEYGPLQDSVSKMLMALILEFLVVIIANLLPYPVWSLELVEERAMARSMEFMKVFRRMIEFYAAEKPNKYDKDQVIRNMHTLKARTGLTKKLLAVSFWENFGMGRGGLRRRVLNSIDDTMAKLFSLLYNAWTSTEDETSAANSELMSKIKPQFVKCLIDLEVILNFAMEASRDGELSEIEKYALEKALAAMKSNEQELSNAFLKARKEATKKGELEDTFTAIRSVEVLAFTVSQILHEMRILAEKLTKFGKKDESSIAPVEEISGFAGVFNNLHDKDHLLKASRYFMAYMMCIYIGWFGFRDVLKNRDAGLAGLAALLLSESMGSAVLKDMSRIQGLVIGTVMCRILGSLILGCEWYWVAAHILLHFFWVFGCLFVMHHSKAFSTAGCLGAALGTATLLSVKCSENDIAKSATFDSLATNCAAVIISMLVDLSFSCCTGKGRASDQACIALDAAWTSMSSSLQELLDPTEPKFTSRHVEIMGHLQTAKAMGAEAAVEPRFWRVDWQASLFDRVLSEVEHLSTVLHVLEQCTDIDGNNDMDAWLVSVLTRSSHLQTQVRHAKEKMEVVGKLLKIFAHETAERFPGFGESTINYEFNLQLGKLADGYLEDEVGEALKIEKLDNIKLSKDKLVHLSMVLASCDRAQALLRNIQHLILQHSWKPEAQ
eukprot:CAMPEP_0197664710 /NCGR_PEP_ID=MMETSP1338-20131121/58799_1 /TAXON_ID=43686 ORGANISM="Pelagodinium beii, Strain RCC1491" /NCGR_SAMPLE_ID=MMETSP1338 /ASSEMBLY_ACC=CAM_ASM_000754 /LENGTH=801 /DNA_ID=CAMNT_0043243405 /DNA_START=254 /DNA_END=2659 /DNA_ORIENTATION=+